MASQGTCPGGDSLMPKPSSNVIVLAKISPHTGTLALSCHDEEIRKVKEACDRQPHSLCAHHLHNGPRTRRSRKLRPSSRLDRDLRSRGDGETVVALLPVHRASTEDAPHMQGGAR